MTEQHDDIQEIYESLLIATNDLMSEYDPMAIAACMLAQALSIYKTALSEEDYNRMIDSISAKRDKIKAFTNDGLLH